MSVTVSLGPNVTVYTSDEHIWLDFGVHGDGEYAGVTVFFYDLAQARALAAEILRRVEIVEQVRIAEKAVAPCS